MALCFIYARQSDPNKKNKSDVDKEETLSLETQIEACRQRAIENNDTIVAIYHEQYTGTVGLSSPLSDEQGRPKYEEMVFAIRANIKQYPIGHAERITKIYVYKYLRLSRDPNGTVPLVGYFRQQGIEVEPVAEKKIGNTPMDDLVLYALMTFGKIQVEDSIAHAKAARRTLENAGKLICAGRPRYGYQYDRTTGTRVINPDTAPIVRRIFTELAQGHAVNKVVMGLRADAIPTPSGRSTNWTHATVYQLVKDTSYHGAPFQAGKVTYTEGRYKGGQKKVRVSHTGNRTIGDDTPAIVTKEVWEAANATVSNRSVAHVRYTHWLIGRVYCRHCGRHCSRAKHHSGIWYWACAGYRENKGCKIGFFPNTQVEPMVEQKLWSFLMDDEIREARLAQLMDKVISPEWESELKRNEQEAEKVRGHIKRTMAKYSTEDDPGMATMWEGQIDKLKADLATRQELITTLAARVEQARKGIETVDAARAILDKLVSARPWLDAPPQETIQAWVNAGVEVFRQQSEDEKRMIANTIGLAVYLTKEGKNRTKCVYTVDVESFRFNRDWVLAIDADRGTTYHFPTEGGTLDGVYDASGNPITKSTPDQGDTKPISRDRLGASPNMNARTLHPIML